MNDGAVSLSYCAAESGFLHHQEDADLRLPHHTMLGNMHPMQECVAREKASRVYIANNSHFP